MNRLGEVAYRRQQYAEARKDYQESLAILRDFGERFHLASTLVRYGEVSTVLGENVQAMEALNESLRLAQEIGADAIALRALVGIAEVLVKEGEKEPALEILSAMHENLSLEHEDKKKATSLLAEIQTDIPLQTMQPGREDGKTKVLNDLVNDVLRSGK